MISVAEQARVMHLFATTVAVDGEPVTTVVASLNTGDVIYTGTAERAEWHLLPPIPTLDELVQMSEEAGFDG